MRHDQNNDGRKDRIPWRFRLFPSCDRAGALTDLYAAFLVRNLRRSGSTEVNRDTSSRSHQGYGSIQRSQEYLHDIRSLCSDPRNSCRNPPQAFLSSTRLLDRVRIACRVRHYSPRTEDAYHHWIKRFILFHHKRHPQEMAAAEINAFLSHLAVVGHVSASTQNQAFSALLFLYQKVLEVDPGRIECVIRAQRPKRLPVVLSQDEVRRIIAQLDGVYRLIALIQYGAGLRLLECLRLRVKDLDGGNNVIVVRHGKGGKVRRTMFPEAVKPELREHVRGVRKQHRRDLDRGDGAAPLPEAFGRKAPSASREFCWQFIFPASTICIDPNTVQRVRWHLHESAVARANAEAVRRAGIGKRATSHAFRHSFATHVLEGG